MNWNLLMFDIIVFGVFGGVAGNAGLTINKWEFWVCLLCMVLVQNRTNFIK